MEKKCAIVRGFTDGVGRADSLVYILTAEKRDPGNGHQDPRVPEMETSCLVG